MIQKIQNRIDALLEEKAQVLVAIDGSCAAGKTTLADRLAALYDCNLLRMDEFFLRPEQRTDARFAQPGGNIDYERFLEEVLQPLQTGRPFTYRPVRCQTFTLGEPVAVQPKQLTIVEGSYSMHPYFGDPYDLKILLTVDPALQRQRILERPAFLHQRFFDAWIPMEQQYLSHFSIPENCDLIF